MTKTTNDNDNEKIASAEEILLPKVEAVIQYGGKEYEMKSLSLEKIFKIVNLVSKSSKKINENYQKLREEKILNQEVNQDGSPAITETETYVSMLKALDEKDIISLISIILDLSENEAKKGFKIVAVMKIVNALLQVEEIAEIFFQIKELTTSIQIR